LSLSFQPHNTNPQARSNTGLVFFTEIRRLFNVCIDLIFPPCCAGCGRVDFVWCEQCQLALESLPVQSVKNSVLPRIEFVASTGQHHGILQKAVQGLKYRNVKLLGEELGNRLAECTQMQDWTIDIMIPVPLHADRLKERGYNQAQVLCEYAAAQLEIPCVPDALQRKVYSKSQVGLSAHERKTNVVDVFSANPDLVFDRSIIIVDDVCTTGSTLSACAQVLLDAGARRVYGLTVTAARGQDDTVFTPH
jgi:ComF family protein